MSSSKDQAPAQSRRRFLTSGLSATTGLLIACQLPLSTGCAARLPHARNPAWEPNAWLQITPENELIFYLDRTEMGQGTFTGMTTLIAEELNTAPHLIRVHTAGVHPDFRNPAYGVQVTGGSTSMMTSWEPLRNAAATAREMLLSAAAQHWHVSPSDCEIRDQQVICKDRHLSFGDLADAASRQTVPDNPTLTPREKWRYIGTSNQRLDAKMKVSGTATFGIDAGVPFAYRAALKRCPVRGGRVRSFDARKAMDMAGVLKVVAIDNGVAVISESYWTATQALEHISVNWEFPELKGKDTGDLHAGFEQALADNDGKQVRRAGSGARSLSRARQTVSATYGVPYLAHATLEPMNCTVVLDEDRCEVWVPTQGPDLVAAQVEQVTGLRRSQITVNTTLMGGGFGRRLNQDFAVECARIAKASGLPVQLIWTREDDTRNDFYRPLAIARLEAGLDDNGHLNTWSYRSASTNILAYAFPETVGAVLPAWFPDGLVGVIGAMGSTLYGSLLRDDTSVEGAREYHYDTPNVEVRHVAHDPGVPVGFLRSVGHSFNGFFVESFMDELAHKANQDPVAYRLKHLTGNPRQRKTLEVLADKGGWGTPSQPQFVQGVASHPSFNSYVSQLAEITVDNNSIRVHRVVCVIDCGTVVNPDIVRMQMESGIIFGLTAALYGKITFSDGQVNQGNFNDYPLLRLNEAPEIEVHLIDSDAPPTGVGEPGVPPIAAAVANAVFRATGKRLRQLPLKLV
ncbi:MAG: xanthine dehydrogenase family protein molybdopterin-binding subunit [Ketobacteraceae bacterium]|nr:xanthine dehydrogenase family protein molybdopterin-binding subunit [Ketobacteraceae bacterium]